MIKSDVQIGANEAKPMNVKCCFAPTGSFRKTYISTTEKVSLQYNQFWLPYPAYTAPGATLQCPCV